MIEIANNDDGYLNLKSMLYYNLLSHNKKKDLIDLSVYKKYIDISYTVKYYTL